MTSKQKDDLDFFFCRLMEHKSSFLDTISKRLLDYEKAGKKKCEADLFASRLESSETVTVKPFVIVRCTYELDEYLERRKNKVIKLNEGRIKIVKESTRQDRK
ncbi:hypothetical protein B9Z55_027164 [Caenorhabditis nigoni]|uniref:Uncharacterized protein n=1 Tax=Caenorhabditis nigoni TaxID=1611254 RepID=A0A2G5SGV3_9PELO|nr:hypothetical protein B9Z55_027164 [Caenorhabditis nigoni]